MRAGTFFVSRMLVAFTPFSGDPQFLVLVD